ncbi:uncharacterized protein LOC118477965, partial [Aplysia californica]|uniref:Uncharacterized protein LOC118477965 n=1 Tax=Aplysia californica TaxID=6500 RepID=A0ABM1VW48_APLCA
MRLQSEGKVKGAGTIFTYSRSSGPDCPGECLTAPGPLNTSLRVELIYFGRNPGIFYHFTVPRDSDYRDAVDSRAAEPSAADDRRHHGHHRRRHHRRHRGDRPEHTSAHEGVPQADVIPAVSQGTSPLHLRRRQHRRQPLRTSHRPSVILRSSYQRPDGKGTHGSASRDRDDDDNTDSRDTRQNSRRPTKKASPPRSYIQIKSKSRLRNKQAPISSKKTPSDSQNQQGAAAPGKSGVGYEQGQFFVKGENGSIQYKHYYHTNVHDGLGDVPIGSANGDEKTSQGSVRYGQKPTRIDSSYDDRYAEFRATTQYQPSSRASIPNVISASLTPQAGVVAAPPR